MTILDHARQGTELSAIAALAGGRMSVPPESYAAICQALLDAVAALKTIKDNAQGYSDGVYFDAAWCAERARNALATLTKEEGT